MTVGGTEVSDFAELPGAFDTLRIGIILHHPESGKVLDCNPRLESIYGYSIEELQRMEVEDFSANTHPYSQEEFLRRVQAAASGTPQNFEWRVKRSNGELIWVDVNLYQTTIESSLFVLGEIRDITEYKTNDRRLSLFYRLLRHNLRNDVNLIAGNAELLAMSPKSADRKTIAETIKETAYELDGIAESVKQIEETITTDRTSRERVRVADRVNEVADRYCAKYPEATITVTEETELWLDTDGALRHALEHAIENAIIHTETGEPVVDIRIHESPNTGRVEISISDIGPPIPADEIEALDEFTETTATKHGSGVRLFVMKWCVESLGGELQFDRLDSGGNAVSFLLPPKPQSSESGPRFTDGKLGP